MLQILVSDLNQPELFFMFTPHIVKQYVTIEIILSFHKQQKALVKFYLAPDVHESKSMFILQLLNVQT